MNRKPLGHKSYGHIAHLPGSRMGPGDHKCHDGQMKIACDKLRDRHDRVIVQEKLDGSNVGVVLLGDEIVPITRAGYHAETSPYIMHHYFAAWVRENSKRFRESLLPGERMCGEWMLVAHGTKYDLPHEPFVAFDLMQKKHDRLHFDAFTERASAGKFTTPNVLSDGPPFTIEKAMWMLGQFGFHGALEQVEGAVWRVERSRLNDPSLGNAGGRTPVVDFLVKYVLPGKEDGKYLNGRSIYNNHS
jgi:hypothetical protein